MLRKRFGCRVVFASPWMQAAAALLLITGGLAAGPAKAADGPSVEDIRRALAKKPKTRSVNPAAANADATLEKHVKMLKTRGTLNMMERDEVFAATAEKPQIDLPIYFEFDSADITPEAKATLDRLGEVLSSDAYKNGSFIVGGHTDGKGAAEYNLSLSGRRADAAKAYLIAKFGFSPDQLVTIGYGSEHLVNAVQPLASENRRVQIVNRSQ